MSYRVDIPTLSTNEVYTLTFEYEGTETIQLIVGDLTLETTDRRVVFTTTSPINYIESNVNLTNLNIYEGYYESDDFGGEYTQESYIEGKSLVDISSRLQPYHTSDTWNASQGSCVILNDGWRKMTAGTSSYNHYRYGVPATDVFVVGKEYTLGMFVRNNNCTTGDFWLDIGHSSHIVKSTETKDFQVYLLKITDLGLSGGTLTFSDATNGDSFEFIITILEGNYYDDMVNGLIQPFKGIGCVKSPKIISQTKHQNLVITDIFKLSSDSSSGATFDKETQTVTVTGSGRYTSAKFWFRPQKWGYKDYSNMCVEFDVVKIGKLKDGDNPYFSLGQYCAALSGYSGSIPLYEGDHVKVAFSTSSISDERNSLIAFNTNGSTGGINNKLVITNFTMYYIDNLDAVGTYDCCKLTTPDDLELHGLSGVKDVLDLTNGLITRKIGKLTNCHELISNHSYNEDGGYYTARLYWNKIQNINTKGNQTLALCNIFSDGSYKPNTIWSHGIDKAYYLHFGGCTTFEEAQQYCLDNNLTILYELKEPTTTEQLSTPLNALKSYRNGSIQTSSQQLTPTLKTTLPISNKFTTTNLTSGSTYNVYFDGTATRLDAGGTIITDPVSPCEVECGGTTLTIEGTDIQNVKVLETTNKNEVGSVIGTTDVELKKIKTYKYENVLDDITYKTSVWNYATININYDDFCIEFMGAHEWAGEFADTGLKYPTGCNLVHVEFDIDMDNPNLRMAINFNEGIYNSYPQHRHVTLNNDTATIAQGTYDNIYTSIITKGHFSRLMYANGDRPIIINLYTSSNIAGILATGNSAEGSIDGYATMGNNYARITNLRMRIIENFSSNYTTVTSVLRDSSYNIIWQDMDMTAPLTISKLEQPIKLRSLGTTYDSYNPVTGELTKRISVSETDGSYSVLSSPVVENVPMGKSANLINTNLPITIDSTKYKDFYFNAQQGTEYTIEFDIGVVGNETECGICRASTVTGVDWITNGKKSYTLGTNKMVITTDTTHPIFFFRIRGENTVVNTLKIVEGNYENSDIPTYTQVLPHLYTNGQVKVYSDSEVYPTTILNGQSTNNYEINGLNTSNSYTIRYDGECESINLANKSNEQGTNRIVKAGATSGNLTFVNDSGDINNVLLVQNDVREQEINHFNGLQTVEVSKMLIENQRNMWTNNPNNYEQINSWQVTSTHYIPVKSGEVIYGTWQENRYAGMTQYDENFNQLMGVNFFGPDSYGTGMSAPQQIDGYYRNQCTILENARYVRFTIPTWASSAIMFYRGSYQTEFVTPTDKIYQGAYIDLPQPVQLNSLPDGTCDTYNPITGEYVQNVGVAIWSDIKYISREAVSKDKKWASYWLKLNGEPGGNGYSALHTIQNSEIPVFPNISDINQIPYVHIGSRTNTGGISLRIPIAEEGVVDNRGTGVIQWLKDNDIHMYYKLDTKITTPITTQLTPITIHTFEGGILQLITTDGKVLPMIEYSMPTNNRYDTSSWEVGAVYTQRNMTEAYFNESTTPMIPTETMTLTTDHISSGSIILNDNGNGLIVLKGNYTGRDIPYFTGMRSVEAIEVETTPSPDQPLFGKGGRK